MVDWELLYKAKNYSQTYYAMTKRSKKPRDPETLRNKSLQIRLSQHEFDKLEAFAQKRDVNMSQVIREYIRRLPNLNKPN